MTLPAPAIDRPHLQHIQLGLHQAAGMGSSLTSAAGALLLAMTVRQLDVGANWAAWLLGVALALLFRLCLGGKATAGLAEASTLRLYRLAFALHGAAWAAGVFLIARSPDSALYLAFALLLMSAGALVIASHDLSAGLLFMLFALPGIPLMLGLGQLPATLSGLCLAGLFIAAAGLSALRSHRAFLEHCRLRQRETEHLLALQRSEEQLRLAQKVAAVGSFDWDPLNGTLAWSDEHFRLWGLAPGSRTPDYALFRSAIHPEDVEALEQRLQQALKGDGAYTAVCRVCGLDGKMRVVRGRGEISFNAQGVATRMIGTVQDISDRWHIEQELETYRFVVNSIASPVSVVDAELRYHLVNKAWCNETGLAADEVLGTSPPALMAVLSSEERREALAACIQHGESRCIETRAQFPGSGLRWWETSFYPYSHQGWKGAVLVSRDITARREDAARLTQSLANLELTLNATGDAIFALYADAPDEPLLFCNQRMLQMWDIAPERRSTLTLNDVRALSKPLYVDPAYEARRLQEIVASGQPSEDRMTLNDGRVLQRRCIPTTGQGRPVRVWSYRDITLEAQAAQQLQQARELAEQANRAKSDFLASMSHELRTPLNAVLGFAQLLEMDPALAQPQQRQVHEILRAGRHLLRLIDEVLDLARIEAGHLHVDLAPVALGPLVESCISLVSASARRLQLHIEAAPMQDLQVLADPQRLQQVLLNLLSNAIKYNRLGGKVSLTWRPEDAQRLRLSITDTGAGIAAERLADLFQPFNRLGAERGPIEGTGIGLSITRRLVQAMGGAIEVQSDVGTGSCFSLLIPLCASPAESPSEPLAETPARPASQAALATPGQGAPRKVLYIEDVATNVALVSGVIEQRPGLTLLAAPDAASGLQLAREQAPALILLDINLPDMNGFQVLEQLRAQAWSRHSKIVALSANAMPADIQRYADAGFDSYLTKPLNIAALLALLDQVLEA